ncbi:MAG: formate--tetrahydrofolate ligase [Oscillospiraceae bacterium]|nr:formate--tetrahydrofolate ligase [Oscillospiraceae bacterium]
MSYKSEIGNVLNRKSDIEIANTANIKPIKEVAEKINVSDKYLELYGSYKAKIKNSLLQEHSSVPDGNLILVTAISPTPAGEGKTTTTIGLSDALNRLGVRAAAAIREPSLGPVFGIKGGAAGGGCSQVIPMEDINLHFTGDIHAVEKANNLLAALIDNHMYQGNKLQIDPRRIVWKRCMDMNDRQLRRITSGLGGRTNGVPREDGFDITVASEIMAILCLSENISELKKNLSKIIVGYTYDNHPVTAKQLNAQGAIALLLKDAVKPNLVQSLENNPVFIHGGPFANIAHGCNSLTATRMSLKLNEYTVTEAGFGADLGAEKFINIKCRKSGLSPSAVVIVASVRALKFHGNQDKKCLTEENTDALNRGIPNLLRHLENITRKFNLPAVVAINRFPSDTETEINLVRRKCQQFGISAAVSDVWSKGGEGGIDLANEVIRICAKSKPENSPRFTYSDSFPLTEKINAVVTKIYGAAGVKFTESAVKDMTQIEKMGLDTLPVCMAKTQYSFSDNPKALGAPSGFHISVTGLKACAGAGFIVVYTGEIMTMPGLPAFPAAEKIDINDDGTITGLS